MALVLNRKEDQRIMLSIPGIEEHVVIQVVSIRPDSVRIGIDAPLEIVIVREELLDDSADSV